MALDTQRERAAAPGTSDAALAAIAEAGRALAEAASLGDALDAVARGASDALAASLVVIRLADGSGMLCARAVCSGSATIAARLSGSRRPPARGGEPPTAVAELAADLGAEAVLVVPVTVAGTEVGALEALRSGRPFTVREQLVAEAAAAQAAAAVRAHGADADAAVTPGRVLAVAGDALAAGSQDGPTADEVAQLAVEATGALGCVVWRRGEDGELHPLAAAGGAEVATTPELRAAAEAALAGTAPVAVIGGAVTIQLDRVSSDALQVVYPPGEAPSGPALGRLATFGARAAHALRAGERARAAALELERTRALLALVGQMSEELSLAHALETVVDRVGELLGAERIGVYLRDERGLRPAASRSLDGPHAPVAERLLELALGPVRGRGILVVEDALEDVRLAGLEEELAGAGIEAAVAVPLVVPDDVVGLLAVYPERGRALPPGEEALVGALASQLAVAVQNARLHDEAKAVRAELEHVLESERASARQLKSLYEISRAFAQSLSLEATLEAVARTVVELLEVDAAVIRMPDARGELLVPRAIHVADVALAGSLRTILERPQPIERLPGRRLFRSGRPLVLDAETAATLGPPHGLLAPFLAKGSTVVVLPIATPGELLGTVKLLSLDPARPITDETIEIGLSIAAQAALAIDNARLYQHQKEFADTMQRSLLPRSAPELAGLELGDVYESSARVDVGGDVYDFMVLEDGRLAVVLGDVTGHGIDAAADMAMAKFVFRSLAREHPDPGDFLAAANDVVCGEIAPGKFITMLYLTIDAASGEVACASAGHPRPRLVFPGAAVEPLHARGLALGIDTGQAYDEVRTTLPEGGAVVLYTDGVIEARRAGELYGAERLDAVLTERRALRPRDLAHAVVADCRAFAGGELADDCAIVVIKRTER